MPQLTSNKVFDLEERTAEPGKHIILWCKQIIDNTITKPLKTQLIKCGTSIGANYCEADDAESKKDFKHKIGICKKESRESKHFIHMLCIAIDDRDLIDEGRSLWNEAKELNLIFNSIFKKVKKD